MMSISKPIVINNIENLKLLSEIVFGPASQKRRDYVLVERMRCIRCPVRQRQRSQ